MSQGFRDEYRNLTAPTPHRTEAPSPAPTFADILDLIRHPKGILSEEEHFELRNFARFALGFAPVEPEYEDEDLEDGEVVS